MGQRLNMPLDAREHVHSYFPLLYNGCHSTICISHPSGTLWGKKRLRKEAKHWSVVPRIPIMHKKAHISQGFKQGLRIGCEGSQMTSRPQFPPYGINKLWFLTLQGWYLPLKTCWRWILVPLKCRVPLISAYNFREFRDLQLQSRVPRFKMHGLGNCCFLTTQKNWQTIIIPYVH